MQKLRNKSMSIVIVTILLVSIGASAMLISPVKAHTPTWQIPTYAYIVAEPNPVGVGQSLNVFMWLDPVYGVAGGTAAVSGQAGTTASSALMSNSYRFQNYQLSITAPNGATNKVTFPVISDTTSSQYYSFTPDQIGTYNLTFTYPGQTYGANGNGYTGSVLINDTYLPSSASTTLTVQEQPIPAAIASYPMPTEYWTRPIYSENTFWWSISSNWIGTGAPVLAGYTSSTLYHGDAIGPQTSHVMWTRPLQFGGVVGGNYFPVGGSDPNSGQGVQYFEGSSYDPRFINPIILNGYLYYTEPVAFSGPTSGPTDCLDLRTGQLIWSNPNIPPLSFAEIYNLWNPDQHGVYPPILFAAIGGGLTGMPSMWECFDAYTGDRMFNVTGVPGFAPQTGQTVAGQSAVALTFGATMGPSGEVLRDAFMNTGTTANPQWYLAQWNSSRLLIQDNNPWTNGSSILQPSIINASNGALVQTFPIPLIGTTATLPSTATIFVPYGSSLTVNGNIPINSTTNTASYSTTTYDWNVSIPWLNTMPLQPTYNVNTGAIVPAVMQGTTQGDLAAGGVCPVSVLATDYGNIMLCRNGSLPTGFKGNSVGYPQLPFTIFAVNLNASKAAVGSILWMKNYDPPAGNITMAFGAVDFQTGVFTFNYEETINWVGYSIANGNLLWGPTAPQGSFDYYGLGNTMLSVLAYGKMYSSQFSGICYSYDDTTGKLLWTYGNGGTGNSTKAGLNTAYGDYPTCIQSIANGVVYLATDEHTINNPIYKGSMMTAINATTGEEIWKLSNYPSEWSTPGSSVVVADGFLTTMNGYDNNIYSVGRGPSTTTISAPQTGLASGQSVAITGTVMDISAGTKQNEQTARFANGVPVASDASMTDWMGYIYQQKPQPMNFTGVPVQLYVVDSNGNYRTIGSANTTSDGKYTLTWTPNISGDYTVTAYFAGTNGYWPSSDTASFTVMNAAPTASPSGCPFDCSFRIILPGRSVLQNTVVEHHLRSDLLTAR
jgi:hypothetical protein